MKMELPDDAEDVSNMAIGAMGALRDLIAGYNQDEMAGVLRNDLGCLVELVKRQIEHAHEIKFGAVPPRPSNND